MFCSENTQRIIKYFLFSILTLSPQCFAAVRTELNEDNHEEQSSKSFRRLRYSWDDDDSTYGSSRNDDGMTIFLIVGYIIIFTIVGIFQCCKKFCNEMGDEYSDVATHPPPRPSRTTHRPPNRHGRNNRTNRLNPPRTSTSIILPQGASAITLDLTGIENPTYDPYFSNISSGSSVNRSQTTNPTPLLDIPPSYDTVVRDENISTSSEITFPVVFEDSPPQYSNILK
ncbi:uncharacterized protein NPIL_234781 [Nephila pilipes]|uniref:Uncharacterized protein n=1 Tax=Nephila pilipes TaxID=299642 RepID=A0A8X6QM79_NEPPI|nr:uncharacterized protein NPIL_234781 [Nephila pilipes]